MIRRKQNDKHYEYDVKAVFVSSEDHKTLKTMAVDSDMSMGRTISKILKDYQKRNQ